MPNGNVYPCCSQAGATEPLLVGNIKELSLKSILKNFNSNMTIRVLRKKGLEWYLDIAKKHNYSKFSNKEYVNTCDLCRTILTDKEFIISTLPYIEKYKIEIYERYKEMILNGNKK